MLTAGYSGQPYNYLTCLAVTRLLDGSIKARLVDGPDEQQCPVDRHYHRVCNPQATTLARASPAALVCRARSMALANDLQ